MDLHILPSLGGAQLRELNVEVAQRFAADLASAGVGPAARRKTLALLGAVLQRSVEWGGIPSNPVAVVRKPSARPERRVQPLPPSIVETMRSLLLADGRRRDATLICVSSPTPVSGQARPWR